MDGEALRIHCAPRVFTARHMAVVRLGDMDHRVVCRWCEAALGMRFFSLKAARHVARQKAQEACACGARR